MRVQSKTILSTYGQTSISTYWFLVLEKKISTTNENKFVKYIQKSWVLKLPSYSHSPRKGCPFGPPGFDGSLKNGAWTFKKRQFPEVVGLSCILIGSCSTSRPSQVLSIVHSIRCSPMFWVENIRNHYGSRPELIKSVAMFRTLYYRWKMWMQIPRPQRQWSYMKMRLYPSSQWKFHFRSDVFHSIQIVRSCAISKSIARCLHLNENK